MFKLNDFFISLFHVVAAFWAIAFYLYSLNIGEAFLFEFLFLISVLFVLGFLLLLTLKKIFGIYIKAAVFITTVYFGFYIAITMYRQIYTVETMISVLKFIKPIYFFIIYFFILFVLIYLIFKKKYFKKKIVNFFSFVFLYLIIFYSFQIYLSYKEINKVVRSYSINKQKFRNSIEKRFNFLENKSEKRDIYYIILDGHASFRDLKRYHNYDPSWFMEELKKRGFLLPNNSKSNYQYTVFSLPSSLNMNYYSMFSYSQNLQFGVAFYLIENNNWFYFMDKLGYKSINIPSSWGPTRRMNRKFNLRDIFFGEFVQTFIYTFTSQFVLSFLYNYIKHNESIEQLEKLKKASKITGPKAVFAHFICPHIPLVFKKNGKLVLKYRNDNQAYIDQLHFFDKQIIKVIDSIFKNSTKKPIIILQSDHGSHGYSLYPRIRDNFTRNDLKNLQFNTLSAFYLPNLKASKLPDDITSVNNFRFIFNNYFGTNFEILENKQFG